MDLTDWRIRGGVDYNFFPGEMLAAGETILIARFDPTDPARANWLAAFQNHYGLTGDERIMADGFVQQLSGSGERVTLLSTDLSPIDPPSRHLVSSKMKSSTTMACPGQLRPTAAANRCSDWDRRCSATILVPGPRQIRLREASASKDCPVISTAAARST